MPAKKSSPKSNDKKGDTVPKLPPKPIPIPRGTKHAKQASPKTNESANESVLKTASPKRIDRTPKKKTETTTKSTPRVNTLESDPKTTSPTPTRRNIDNALVSEIKTPPPSVAPKSLKRVFESDSDDDLSRSACVNNSRNTDADEVESKEEPAAMWVIPNSGSSTINLLDPSSAPEPADVSRPRKMPKASLGTKPKTGYTHKTQEELDEYSVDTRLSQYPGQPFEIRLNKFDCRIMYCHYCKAPVNHLTSSHVNQHIDSQKHKAGSLTHFMKKADETEMKAILKKEMKRGVVGFTLPEETLIKRLRTLRALMIGGIARSKIFDRYGELAELLQEFGKFSLSETQVNSMIRILTRMEIKSVKHTLEPIQQMTLIFDAATETAEVFAVVARYWQGDTFHQRLISVDWLSSSLDAQRQAAHLVQTIMRKFDIDPARIIACIRDGSSVNGACGDLLKQHNLQMLDIACVSHTICRCDVFNCPSAASFLSKWSHLISDSGCARLLFRRKTTKRALRKRKTRWFTEYQLCAQVWKFWDTVIWIIKHPGTFAPNLRASLKEMIEDGPLDILRRELALILDVGKPMVELCYLSEGDNVLAPRVHNDLKPVHAMMRAIDNPERKKNKSHYEYLPTVRSVAAEFAQKYPTNKVDDIVEQTCKKAEKVATVFLDLFYTKHLTVTRLWGFCSLFFPPSVVETKSRENMVTKINMFMIELLDHHTDNLIKEINVYLEAATTFDPDVSDLLDFWNRMSRVIPTWYECFKTVALLQPSSAAVERVFAQLRKVFREDQESTLADYKSTCLMLRYNRKQRIDKPDERKQDIDYLLAGVIQEFQDPAEDQPDG